MLLHQPHEHVNSGAHLNTPHTADADIHADAQHYQALGHMHAHAQGRGIEIVSRLGFDDDIRTRPSSTVDSIVL